MPGFHQRENLKTKKKLGGPTQGAAILICQVKCLKTTNENLYIHKKKT